MTNYARKKHACCFTLLRRLLASLLLPWLLLHLRVYAHLALAHRVDELITRLRKRRDHAEWVGAMPPCWCVVLMAAAEPCSKIPGCCARVAAVLHLLPSMLCRT